MTGRTHIMFATATAVAYVVATKGQSVHNAVPLVPIVFGATVPDFDADRSLFRKYCPCFIGMHFHHRGIGHSLFFLYAVLGLSLLLIPYYTPWIMIGMLSHYFADALNPSGVPLFYGTSIKDGDFSCNNWYLHLLPKSIRIYTGSAGDTLFLLVSSIIVIYAVLAEWVTYTIF
jgi:membrane-bound metal-dependent hydrolase YbcI (DUF457 family)